MGGPTVCPVGEFTVTGLRTVLEVARAGSFSAAATELGYTQSAISRQVALMEQVAGTPLFRRHARGVRPTAAGEVLLRHAARVVASVGAASQELAGMRDRLAGRLVVGGFPTVAARVIPLAVAGLRERHPGLTVRLLEGSSQRHLRAVRQRRAEVVVVATGKGLPDLDLDGLGRHELRFGRGIGIAVAESNPLASRSWVAPADLADEPWIVGAGAADAPQFAAWPDLEDPRIEHAVRDWPTRLGLVAADLGIALVPGSAADTVPRGVRWVPVRSDRGLERAAWAVTDAAPGPAAMAMVGLLQRHAAALGTDPHR